MLFLKNIFRKQIITNLQNKLSNPKGEKGILEINNILIINLLKYFNTSFPFSFKINLC